MLTYGMKKWYVGIYMSNKKMSLHLRDYIYRVEDFLDKDFCKTLIKKSKKLPWHKHSYSDANKGLEVSFDNDLSVVVVDTDETFFINQKIKFALDNYIKHFNFPWFTDVHNFSPIRLNKYDITTEMKLHCDHISSLFDGKEKGVPVLTILGTLNENYEGGDFVMFDNENIPMPTGTLLIFPASFLFPHAVLPITKGTRYSFVSWSW